MATWVGRYAMVGGEVREHGPWLVDRQRQREEESLRLLVLAEPADERSAEFCSEVAEAVAALFAREALSITGGLLRALQQTHANLAEWNRRSLREHRVAVGVTCVVVRDGQVTIAQVGPGVAYVCDPAGVTRLGTEGLPAEAPMGGEAGIEPHFTATSLPGREVLLLTTAAEQAVGAEAVEAALRTGPERALAELFRQTRGVAEMTAVLVADLELDEEQAAPPLEEPEDALEAGPVGPAPVESAPAEPEAPPPPRRGPVRRVGRSSGPSMPRLRQAPVAAAGPGGRGGGRGLPWRWIAGIVGLLIAIALLAWAFLPELLREDRAAQLEQAIVAAETQMHLADGAGSVDEQRAALRQALVELEAARSLEPGEPRVRSLEALAEARLAQLDAVTAVEELTPLLLFDGSLTAPVTAEAIAVGGRAVWLLESGRGRVVRVDPAGGEPREVYRAGETYGPGGGGEPAAGPPLVMTWDGAGGRLLVLDERHTLYAIADDPDGEPAPQRLELRDAAELRSVAALAAYRGNLYLLDGEAGEVWRYLPAATGFDSERTGVLGGTDMAAAAGLAVDGDVFVLDGASLRHFRQGRELAPLLRGIDEPPQGAVALVQDAVRGLFYVADRGQRRIVAGDREGAFVRQFRHPDFADLRGIAVSGDGERIYVLTGDRIAVFSTRASDGGQD